MSEQEKAAMYTPGPWKISDEGRRIIVQDRSDIGTSGVLIGSASAYPGSGFFPGEEEGDANARLIAAAPDLLQACENYLYGRKPDRDCEAEMRAAIAKATGAKP